MVVRRGDVAGRRDVLARFLKATIEGNYLALADAKRAKEVLAEELKISDPKILDITYNDFKALTPPTRSPRGRAPRTSWRSSRTAAGRLEDYVDTSLLDALRSGRLLRRDAAEVPSARTGAGAYALKHPARLVIAARCARAALACQRRPRRRSRNSTRASRSPCWSAAAPAAATTPMPASSPGTCRKHLPGHPTFIAKNMPAAAGLAAASALYTTADKDGATIAAFPNNVADGPAVRQSGRALRRAEAQLARQHRQAAERLRDLAHEPDQDHRGGARARGDRGRGRRHLEHRDHAEAAQRAARHQLQGDRRLRSAARASRWRSSAARRRAFAGCPGRP